MPSSPPPESRCSTTTVTHVRASSSPMPSCWASRTDWWWRIAASMPADSNTASVARAPAPSSPRRARSPSCARASRLEAATPAARVRPLLLVALAALGVGVPHAARADQQRDPQLQAVVAKAIAEAQCFTDQYDSAVWYTLMEPRLRRVIRQRDERLDILKQVYCETHRRGEARLPPGLGMALLDGESRLDRWAGSPPGAGGLMPGVPVLPPRPRLRRYELVHVAPHPPIGCAVLRV